MSDSPGTDAQGKGCQSTQRRPQPGAQPLWSLIEASSWRFQRSAFHCPADNLPSGKSLDFTILRSNYRRKDGLTGAGLACTDHEEGQSYRDPNPIRSTAPALARSTLKVSASTGHPSPDRSSRSEQNYAMQSVLKGSFLYEALPTAPDRPLTSPSPLLLRLEVTAKRQPKIVYLTLGWLIR